MCHFWEFFFWTKASFQNLHYHSSGKKMASFLKLFFTLFIWDTVFGGFILPTTTAVIRHGSTPKGLSRKGFPGALGSRSGLSLWPRANRKVSASVTPYVICPPLTPNIIHKMRKWCRHLWPPSCPPPWWSWESPEGLSYQLRSPTCPDLRWCWNRRLGYSALCGQNDGKLQSMLPCWMSGSCWINFVEENRKWYTCGTNRFVGPFQGFFSSVNNANQSPASGTFRCSRIRSVKTSANFWKRKNNEEWVENKVVGDSNPSHLEPAIRRVEGAVMCASHYVT